jgi:hypothetical protein
MSLQDVLDARLRDFSTTASRTSAYKKILFWSDEFVRDGQLERHTVKGRGKTFYFRRPQAPPPPPDYEVDDDGWPVLPRDPGPEPPAPPPGPSRVWTLHDVHYWLAGMAGVGGRDLADRLTPENIKSAARAVRASLPGGE